MFLFSRELAGCECDDKRHAVKEKILQSLVLHHKGVIALGPFQKEWK